MGKLAVLMATAFVDMIGAVMILPLIPFYADTLGASGLVIGMLISAFSIAQLVSAPLWGKLSDRHGRRPVLVLGLAISAASYVVFAYAESLWLLFVARAVQGLGGGTVGVIQAYVADASAPEDRAKGLGWLSAATSLGVIVGPALGSVLAAMWGRAAPGLGAAVLCLLNLAFAWRFLTESREMRVTDSHAIPTPARRLSPWQVLANPAEPASRLIWTYAVAIGAFYGIVAVFTMFLGRQFGIGEKTIGYFFMWFGAAGVIVRTTLVGPAVRWLGEVRMAQAGIVLLAAGLTLFPFSRNYPVLLFAMTLMPLGTAFTFPAVTALLSRVVPSRERGLYMGVQQTVGGVSRVIFPWWDGWAFDHIGMAAPFVVCGALTAGTLWLVRGLQVPAKVRPEATQAEAPADTGIARPPAQGIGVAGGRQVRDAVGTVNSGD
ncbi:MAG TPA: MFS transporter [Gemmatimonadaceae bacterium]|nr:MFS transporter [Gemmatimonadaceae bacterium]